MVVIISNYKYVFIRENGGFDKWIMENLLPLVQKKNRYKMERLHIENIEHTNLNKSIPCRTKDEWRLDNKEKIKEYAKQYRECSTKNKLNEYAKQYKEVNKEKLNEYAKQYKEVNKEKIKEKQKEKMTCECGSTFTKCNKARHEKTNKAQKLLYKFKF